MLFKQTESPTAAKRICVHCITEDPCYNDSVCYQRFCYKIKFAAIKKLDMDPSKARIMDSFEQSL